MLLARTKAAGKVLGHQLPNIKWSVVSARRLVKYIRASGGTPLAEVYGLLLPVLKSFKPDIFVTLTDGEPSDFDAVRQMVLSYRKMAIHMMAIGVGRNLHDSVGIGHNLKDLDYEKGDLGVSRLQDIPKKVIKLLRVRYLDYYILIASFLIFPQSLRKAESPLSVSGWKIILPSMSGGSVTTCVPILPASMTCRRCCNVVATSTSVLNW